MVNDAASMGTGLRIAFFGTPDFAVPSLQRLIASRHPVVGVVTQPDRPRDRGHRVVQPPIKQIAIAHQIPVLQPDTLRNSTFLTDLAGLNADLGVVAAYGKLLPDAVLRTPRLGLINVHASLLPRHRGAAPVHRAILAGDRETGITIMRIVKALDAGPMLAMQRRSIERHETSEMVERDLAALGADLLLETIEHLAAGTAVEIPQDDDEATYAPRLSRADGLIDWTTPAHVIHNQVRGLHPWPHAWTNLSGTRLVILRTLFPEDPSGTEPSPADRNHSAVQPGTVLHAHGDDFIVQAGDGRPLRILQVQLEGRRPMTVRDFLAGHHVPPGSILRSTPVSNPKSEISEI